jgi:hypothetical protein
VADFCFIKKLRMVFRGAKKRSRHGKTNYFNAKTMER